jgi:uncharacterized protein YjiK
LLLLRSAALEDAVIAGARIQRNQIVATTSTRNRWNWSERIRDRMIKSFDTFLFTLAHGPEDNLGMEALSLDEDDGVIMELMTALPSKKHVRLKPGIRL